MHELTSLIYIMGFYSSNTRQKDLSTVYSILFCDKKIYFFDTFLINYFKPHPGDFSGTSTCAWSTKLAKCVSAAMLPLFCSNAQCGVVHHKAGTCPIEKCAKQKRCSACLSMRNCGWCAKGAEGYGQCMDGDFLGMF